MGNTFFFDWEVKLQLWSQLIECPVATALATFFSMLGEEYLLIIILGFFYWCLDKDLGRKLSLAITGTLIYGSLIKGTVMRLRPYMVHSDIKCIRAPHPEEDPMSLTAQSYSMPSLHAAMSAAAYGTLARQTKKKPVIVLCVLLPFFIGLSRIYLGVHYPTDVLAGWLLGVILIFVLGAVERRFGYKGGLIVSLAIGALGFIVCRDNDFYSGWGIELGMLLGFMYEEKHVKFEMPKKWWNYVLRPLLGMGLFVGVNALLKLLGSGIRNEALAFAYRIARYAVTAFAIIGFYPLLFKFETGRPHKSGR